MATKRAAKRRTKSSRKPVGESIGGDGLTNKQHVFVDEYLICWNASEAARRAGYSEKTAYSIGSENLRKPEIRQIIKRRLSTMAMQADEVLARLSAIASADMSEFLMPSGRGVKLDLKRARAAGQLRLVKKYNKTRQGVSVELYDAQAALVQIGKYHGLFAERIKIEPSEAVMKLMKELGLTLEDVRHDPLAIEWLRAAGVEVEIAGESVAPDRGAEAERSLVEQDVHSV